MKNVHLLEFADYEKQANKQKEKKERKNSKKDLKKESTRPHFQYDFFSSMGSINTRSNKLDKYKIAHGIFFLGHIYWLCNQFYLVINSKHNKRQIMNISLFCRATINTLFLTYW